MTTERAAARLHPTVIALGITSSFTDVGSEMIFPTALPSGLLMGYLWQTFGALAALAIGALLAGVAALSLLAWRAPGPASRVA